MPADLNKKTIRHFYCRDGLWQCFERISEDLDRGVDDLVNEAMRLFAREKGYLSAEGEARIANATLRGVPGSARSVCGSPSIPNRSPILI